MTFLRSLTRIFVSLVGAVLGVMVVAALPAALQATDRGLHLDLSAFWHTISRYVSGLVDGSSFSFNEGWFGVPAGNFLESVGRALRVSFPYIGLACAVAVTVAIVVGLSIGGTKREHLQDLLGGIGAIPDFILALVLQIAVVAVYKATGWRLARVATIAADERALLLPLLVLCIIPTAYLLKGTSSTVRQVLGQEFIMTARAQGLSRAQVLRRHVLPHALVHIRASSARLAALLVGNLFIVEYLFNSPGITHLVFRYAFWRGYQPNLVINSLLVVMLVFAVLWASVYLLALLLEKTVARI